MELKFQSTGLSVAREYAHHASESVQATRALATAKRINGASDDTAGLSISTKLTSNLLGLSQGLKNANAANALLETADGSVSTGLSMLQRIRELAVQAASDTNDVSDRAKLDHEAQGLVLAYTNHAETTAQNKTSLVDGSFNQKFIQLGADAASGMYVSIGDIRLQQNQTYRGITDATLATSGGDTGIGAGTFTLSRSDGLISVAIEDGLSAAQTVSRLSSTLGDTVTMRAETRLELSNINSTGTYSFNLNGQYFQTEITNTSDLSDLAQQINDRNGSLNLQAEEITPGKLHIISESGEDISLTDFTTDHAGGAARVASLGLDSSQTGTTQGVHWETLTAGYTNTVTDTEITLSGFSFLANVELDLNGTNVGPITIADPTDTTVLRTAINALSGVTGVQAGTTGTPGDIRLTSTTPGGTVDLTVLGGGITSTTNTITTSTPVSPSSEVHVTGQIEFLDETVFQMDHVLSAGGLGFVQGATTAEIDEVSNGVDLTSREGALDTIEYLDANIARVSQIRGDIGAYQNRIFHAVESITSTHQNIATSRSAIEDLDISKVSARLARSDVLAKASSSLMGQLSDMDRETLSTLLR